MKAAYDYIREIEGKAPGANDNKAAKGLISAKLVSQTEKAAVKEDKIQPALWTTPGKGVGTKEKNILLSMGGGSGVVGSESEEDVYKAFPATSTFIAPAKIEKESGSTMMAAPVYATTYENGQKPVSISNVNSNIKLYLKNENKYLCASIY